MQPKWWFTVTVYIYLYVWKKERKILTCQMKRKMKGRDRIPLMGKQGGGGPLGWKTEGENLQSENIRKQLKPCTSVNAWECQCFCLDFSLIPDLRVSSLSDMFISSQSTDPENQKEKHGSCMPQRSFLAWGLFLQSLETRETSRAAFRPSWYIFSSFVLQRCFGALGGGFWV